MASEVQAPDTAAQPRWPWLSLAILLLMSVLANIDKTVITLMVDPIKHDLGLSDIQFSLLQGFAFALFYGLASIPMGWLADRVSRRAVIFWGVVGWSISTAACGLARTFPQLFIARLAVGAGEATLSPASYAMIGDLFPPRRLALAAGILAAGTAIGGAIAYTVGGLLVRMVELANPLPSMAPWQVVFLIVGLPGVVLAPLIFIIPAVRRPRTTAAAASAAGDDGYVRWLRANATYLLSLFLGIGFMGTLAYGSLAWTPAYMSRHFGVDMATIGATLGAVMLFGGVFGFIGGGWLTDRLHAASGRDVHFRFFIFNATMVTILGVVAFHFVGSVPALLAMIGIIQVFQPVTGPAMAHLQARTPPQYRARTIALLTLFLNLMGMSLGPTSVAFFSDKLLGGPAHIGGGIALLFMVYGPLTILCFLVGLLHLRARERAGTALRSDN